METWSPTWYGGAVAAEEVKTDELWTLDDEEEVFVCVCCAVLNHHPKHCKHPKLTFLRLELVVCLQSYKKKWIDQTMLTFRKQHQSYQSEKWRRLDLKFPMLRLKQSNLKIHVQLVSIRTKTGLNLIKTEPHAYFKFKGHKQHLLSINQVDEFVTF